MGATEGGNGIGSAPGRGGVWQYPYCGGLLGVRKSAYLPVKGFG
jgi:hypothetical protein